MTKYVCEDNHIGTLLGMVTRGGKALYMSSIYILMHFACVVALGEYM